MFLSEKINRRSRLNVLVQACWGSFSPFSALARSPGPQMMSQQNLPQNRPSIRSAIDGGTDRNWSLIIGAGGSF